MLLTIFFLKLSFKQKAITIMINMNETPIPPVEEAPLDAKLIPADPLVGQEFQTTITVDDIDAPSSAQPVPSAPAIITGPGSVEGQPQANSEQAAAAAGGAAGLLGPITNFIRGGTVGAAISARLSDPPQGIRSIQPWAKFFGDKTKYSIPGLHYIWPRLQSNFSQFKYNYFAIAIAILFLLA